MLKAMADPARIRILGLLLEAPYCVSDLCNALAMSEAAVGHHLRVLRQNRLARRNRVGRKTYYLLADGHIQVLFQQILEHSFH